MDHEVESSAESRPQSALRGAHTAASSRAMSARVTELETLLAVERAENARRMREVDGHMRVMRAALQNLQADFRRISGEREELRTELDGREREIERMRRTIDGLRTRADDAAMEREGAAADVVASSIGRAQEAEAALSTAREEIEKLSTRVLELEAGDVDLSAEEYAALQQTVRQREEELIRAAEVIGVYESRLDESERRAGQALQTVEGLRQEFEAGERRAPVAAEPTPSPAPATVEKPAPTPETDEDTYFDVAEGKAEKKTSADSPSADGSETYFDVADGTPGDNGSGAKADESATYLGVPVSASSVAQVTNETEPPERPPARREARVVAGADQRDDGFPVIDGLRFESIVEKSNDSELYHARTVEGRRAVAVRVLPGASSQVDTKQLDALVLARHANIVSAIAHGSTARGPYIVFERPVGEPADAWVERIGPLPERIALAVALQLARGLRQAAFHGVVHGDLVPSCVRIDPSGRVQVLDVGRAALAPSHRRVLRAPAFAAPEALRGSPPVDARSDIYSLGALIHFLVTGAEPFEGDAKGVLRAQAGARFPDPREARPELSAKLSVLVRRMTHYSADQRPATWDEVLIDLEHRAPGESSDELRGNLAARVRRFATLRPYATMAIAVLPLLLAAVLLFAGTGRESTARERFDEAVLHAERLVDRGDVVEAERLYRTFLTGTGDAAVEREAAERLDVLRRR